MIKRDEMTQPNSCLNKTEADEPIFVLRASDPLAPLVVAEWACVATEAILDEIEKVTEAYHLGQQMREWRAAREGK